MPDENQNGGFNPVINNQGEVKEQNIAQNIDKSQGKTEVHGNVENLDVSHTFNNGENPDIQLANELEQVWKESIDGNEPRAIPEPPAPEGAVDSSEPQEINFEELNTGGELFGAMRTMAETEPEPEKVEGFVSRFWNVAKKHGPKLIKAVGAVVGTYAEKSELGNIGQSLYAGYKAIQE